MSAFKTATDQITAALARLEAAVERAPVAAGGAGLGDGEQPAILRERDELRQRTAAAAARLDDAIGQIENILGRDESTGEGNA